MYMLLQDFCIPGIRFKRNDSSACTHSFSQCHSVKADVSANICDNVAGLNFRHHMTPHVGLILFRQSAYAWSNKNLISTIDYAYESAIAEYVNNLVVDRSHSVPKPGSILKMARMPQRNTQSFPNIHDALCNYEPA